MWKPNEGVSRQEEKELAVPEGKLLASLDGLGSVGGLGGDGHLWATVCLRPPGQGQLKTARLCMMALGGTCEHFNLPVRYLS